MNFNVTCIFLLAFLRITSINANGPNFKDSGSSHEDVVGKWKLMESAVKRISMNAMKFMIPSLFRVSTTVNISRSCRSSFTEMAKGLYQQKMWAFKMLDASGKNIDGLFSGSPTSLGDYDECLSVQNPSNKFQGKYCMADVGLPLPPRRSFTRIEDEIPELKKIVQPGTIGAEAVKYAPYMYASQLRIALCVPSTCSAEEVERVTLKVLENANFYFNVDVLYCEVLENVPYTTGEILIIIIFITLLTIVTSGTIIDLCSRSEEVEPSEKSLPLKLILCFSAYSNFQHLLKKDDNPDSLSIFHGLRVITIAWIILCHTYFTVNFKAHDGLLHAKDIPKSFWFSPIINGHLSVDTFIFMSAVLVPYLCMRIRGKVNVPLYFAKRYWRLTPTMMLVIAIAVIGGRFGSGPIWRETYVELISNRCKRNGWWNLLYINNFFSLPELCLGWTWYLATDTQLFFIALYVVIVLKRSVKKGFIVILLLLLFSTAWTAGTVIYYHLPPVYLQSFFNYDDWTTYADRMHTPFPIHLSITAIGLFVGYVLATKKIHIPKHINAIGWLSTGIAMPAVIFGVYSWNQGNIPGVAASAFYAASHRIVWGLCLGFITLSCTTKKKGIVYSILSWEAFVPLGRLTFVVYLIHYLFIYFYTASIRSTYTYNHLNMIFKFVSVLTLTFIISCPLSLVIESPFMALEKVLTNREMEKKILPVGYTNGVEEKNSKESI